MTQDIKMTIGLDVGDRGGRYCVLDGLGAITEEGRFGSTEVSLRKLLGERAPARVILEVGGHSRWMNELIGELGHDPVVANARQLKLIYASDRKSDRIDAEKLARLGRFDLELLRPICHRGAQAQEHLAILKARDGLVACRTDLINRARGLVKSHGARLSSCSTAAFARRVRPEVPEALRPALEPLLDTIQEVSERIRQLDKDVGVLSETQYPQTAVLRQIAGVGPLTALGFMLTVEEPERFAKNRDVGAYLGLTPRMDQSGKVDKQLGITKAGDPFLRRLVVQAAHYILGPFGPDTDLRRFGERLTNRGGKAAKKRAITAVARKLAVLLLALWKTAEVYEPLRNSPAN